MSERARDLARLCRSCGLCCDGSLFGRVPLAQHEVATARRHRLRVIAGEGAFEQPCTALVETADGARSCTMYEARPQACRAFVCRLYERYAREGGQLGPCLDAVRRVRELLAIHRADPESVSAPTFAELTRRLDEDFARAANQRPESPRTREKSQEGGKTGR